MCGIAGVLYFDQTQASEPMLKAMGDRISHRGPDDHGTFVDGPLGFAHRRLSILDLSKSGHQPMFTAGRELAIVYNGECYNFPELRKDLEARGHVFKSNTDTEVVLNGFLEHGPDFVKKMVGMFAFAVWNLKTRELYLVRDRLGVKPLYYSVDSKRIVFASEIKALLEAGVEPELEGAAVSSFFSLRYVPGETTLFKGVRKLASGDWLRATPRGDLRMTTYWSLVEQDSIKRISFNEAQERYFELFDQAVSGCLLADVPVGAFLSGGIDSAAIAAMMKHHQSSVETFTFGVGGEIDESDRAREVAAAIGVGNTVTRLGPKDYELYPKVIRQLEEPIGDSIIVPTYLLAREAAKKVKVVQLGEGADEILGGYVHQLAMTYGNLFGRMMPSPVRRSLVAGLQGLPQIFWDKFFPYPAKLGQSGVKRVLTYLGSHDSPGHAYVALAGLFNESEKENLFEGSFYREQVRAHPPSEIFAKFWSTTRNPDFKNQLQQLDLRYWNTDYGMLRMDKLTMAHSIEARVPYLDHRLVEFCLQLPRNFKTRGFKQKLLMRRGLANRGLLPESVLTAPKKAFYLPVEKCFGRGFEDFVRDVLSDSAISRRGLFNLKAVQKLRDDPNRELIHNKQLVALMCFELWAASYLDGNWRAS